MVGRRRHESSIRQRGGGGLGMGGCAHGGVGWCPQSGGQWQRRQRQRQRRRQRQRQQTPTAAAGAAGHRGWGGGQWCPPHPGPVGREGWWGGGSARRRRSWQQGGRGGAGRGAEKTDGHGLFCFVGPSCGRAATTRARGRPVRRRVLANTRPSTLPHTHTHTHTQRTHVATRTTTCTIEKMKK
ncbi:hypothetical protein I4F81_005295 [Pyropia yezoensis]|uniref:Uncharacterized protein n=1 Tax=Pyropia yezoensis TaxID=2788 RepID=A0ACC3BYS3_PYRYE|nr:hypothetical protein I4F81_005295 [Neopyropia yezoensis]